MSEPSAQIAAAAETHAGHQRLNNEDCFLADGELGLYVVLDGMGGHNAGDVASALAKQVIHDYVAKYRSKKSPRAVLEGAFRAASTAIYNQAKDQREQHGMGTTVVACVVEGERRAVVAHVGDSRAYLLRDGRLELLTHDHTVVAELVAKGVLSPEEATRHPYKSVLSRNLGGRPEARTDVVDVKLQPGDRLLLCSDGLNGFATHEAMEQVLAGADDVARAAADLIALALRGGGGDNVTAVVVEAGRLILPESTQILRRNAAEAWWSRRDAFLGHARKAGIADSPICAVLSKDEAVDIVAGNLAEAIYHDLEQTAGLYVWTYAENLASGWLDQAGDFAVLRDLGDRLGRAIDLVVADVAADDAGLAVALETQVLRGLLVAEMAMAEVIADRMRTLEAEWVTSHSYETLAPTGEDRTMPFIRSPEAAKAPPAVAACLVRAHDLVRDRLRRSPPQSEALACLAAIHAAALAGGDPARVARAARELYGSRPLGESGVAPLIDGLDQVRALHLVALREQPDPVDVRGSALRQAVMCHQAMTAALAGLVTEAAREVSESLRLVSVDTAKLRAELGVLEGKVSKLERARRSKARSPSTPTVEIKR